MQSRGDTGVPFDECQKPAAMIPGARWVSLEARNHVLLEKETAQQRFVAEVRDFLGAAPGPAAHDVPGANDALVAPAMAEPTLTAAERDVLQHVAQDMDNGAIVRQLHKTMRTYAIRCRESSTGGGCARAPQRSRGIDGLERWSSPYARECWAVTLICARAALPVQR